MTNLISASLWRLRKSKAFLLALLATLAYTALVVLVCWDHYDAGNRYYTMESILTAGFGLMGYLSIPSLIAAPLLSVHLGTEYADRTLRRKLIAGHTRRSIYLADLTACVLTVLALDVLYLVLSAALCVYPVLGMAGRLLRVSPGQMLAWVAVGLLARAAFAAVLTLLSTLLGSRTASAVGSLLLVVGTSLFCAAGSSQIQYLINHPGAEDQASRLASWQLVMDILPTGQYLQISRLDTPNLWRMPLLSLLVIAAATAAGMAFFQRKNLK